MGLRIGVTGILVAVVTLGCSPTQSQQSAAPSSTAAPQSHTLILANRYEPTSLAPKVQQGNGQGGVSRLFNAALTVIDDKAAPQPYLAETLPQLNTDTWQVSADGRMETTYRLRDNLTWQDGAPLTADDFVFALQIYKDPGLGGFLLTPQNVIDSVQAPDPRTVVIEWSALSPIAGALTFGDLDPLPSHLLAAPYADFAAGRTSRDAFLNDAFWTSEYVGAGPYHMDHWDPGVEMDGSAFDGHILGKPRIDHIVARTYTDENQTLAAILAGGTLDYACCTTLRFGQLATLKSEWADAGKGTARTTEGPAVFLFQQLRPEYIGDPALLDLRVRQALAHAIDRQALNDGLFNGLGSPTESPVPPSMPFAAEVDRSITKYPLDLNATSALMNQAGYTRGADGFYADAQGNHVHVDFTVQQGSDIEQMQNILSDSWKQAGFEVRPVVMAPALYSQLEVRDTIPGLGYSFLPMSAEGTFISSQIPSAANGWAGNNRSGWNSPEYDQLWTSLSASLDPTERGHDIAQMMALVSANLPGYALYFSESVEAWDASLQGASPAENTGFGQNFRGPTAYWDIQNWWFS